MGLFDILTGKRKLKAAGREPAVRHVDGGGDARDDARAAQSSGKAAIVFQPLATADFSSIVDRHGGGPARHRRGHRHQRRAHRRRASATAGWSSSDEDFEDLVVGINVVSQALQDGGYGERILCAVFAFRDAHDQPVYWIYNYKRGVVLPVRARRRRPAPRHRARAAAQGPDRPRAARRAGARALVPALGHPDLVRDQPVAVNSWCGLDEREVGRREDHVGLLQLVVAELVPVACARARASPRRPRGSGPRRRPRPPRPPRCRAR